MTRKTWFLLAVMALLLCGSIARAQDSAEERDVTPPDTSEVDGADAERFDSARPAQVKPLEGDVVVFKKGSELRGVKVVRQSPLFVEIEYLPGEPALKIPRSQVSEVIYAKTDDASDDVDTGLTLGPDIMPGEEVSAAFNRSLTSVLSEEPLEYENEDYLSVIRTLCADAGVEVDVDTNLEALPEEARTFSYTVPAGTTLLDFLRRDLAEIAPELRVILHYDRLILQKRLATPPLPADPPLPVEAPAEGPGALTEPAPEAAPDIEQ